MRQPVTRKDVFATGESTRHPMTSPSDEVFNGAAAWVEVAELNQRLYDARARIRELEEALGRVRDHADWYPNRLLDDKCIAAVHQALTPEKREAR